MDLPTEVLVTLIEYLSCGDVARWASTSRQFRSRIMQDENLWYSLCKSRFGSIVASRTISDMHYGGDWRDMLRDDCSASALPTLMLQDTKSDHGISYCTRERANCHYGCVVHCIKWHRPSQTIRVYVDLRGESDLRNPFQSCTICLDSYRYNGRFHAPRTGSWVSELAQETPGHFKGYLSIPDKCLLHKRGVAGYTWIFDFVPNFSFRGNLEPIVLLDFRNFQCSDTVSPLEHAFRGPCSQYTLDVSPFQNDTPAIERERWTHVFDSHVLDAQRGHRLWWT